MQLVLLAAGKGSRLPKSIEIIPSVWFILETKIF